VCTWVCGWVGVTVWVILTVEVLGPYS